MATLGAERAHAATPEGRVVYDGQDGATACADTKLCVVKKLNGRMLTSSCFSSLLDCMVALVRPCACSGGGACRTLTSGREGRGEGGERVQRAARARAPFLCSLPQRVAVSLQHRCRALAGARAAVERRRPCQAPTILSIPIPAGCGWAKLPPCASQRERSAVWRDSESAIGACQWRR